MKKVQVFWNNRSSYEKAVLGLFVAFILFCLGYFSNGLYLKWKCAVCSQTLRKGEHYILDVRTGEILALSEYVDRESSTFWLSPVSHMPQEVSVTDRKGYMRFPRQVSTTTRYCANHTANLDSDFLMLAPEKAATVCYAVLDGQTLTPDGQIITKRLNEELNCWELEIQWNDVTPALPS